MIITLLVILLCVILYVIASTSNDYITRINTELFNMVIAITFIISTVALRYESSDIEIGKAYRDAEIAKVYIDNTEKTYGNYDTHTQALSKIDKYNYTISMLKRLDDNVFTNWLIQNEIHSWEPINY